MLGGMLREVGLMVELGTDYEVKSTMEIAILAARNPSLGALFNFASQAHNNHFFFDTLVSPHREPSAIWTDSNCP